jgi:hypothetical protein
VIDSWVRMWKEAFAACIIVLFQSKGLGEASTCPMPWQALHSQSLAVLLCRNARYLQANFCSSPRTGGGEGPRCVALNVWRWQTLHYFSFFPPQVSVLVLLVNVMTSHNIIFGSSVFSSSNREWSSSLNSLPCAVNPPFVSPLGEFQPSFLLARM